MIERVVLDDTASPDDVERVADVLRRSGFAVEPEPIYSRRSAEILPWIIQVVLAAPVAAFFISFGSEGGKDAYGLFREWVKELWQSREGSGAGRGSIDLRDPDGTHVILTSTIPDEALEALRALDWSQERGAYLVWDGGRRAWRDPTRRRRPT